MSSLSLDHFPRPFAQSSPYHASKASASFSNGFLSKQGQETEEQGLNRGSLFKSTAGRVINPNSITIAKGAQQPFSSPFSPQKSHQFEFRQSLLPKAIPRHVIQPEIGVNSLAGSVRGRLKNNQDAYFVEYDTDTDTHLLGVCDGHGQHGGAISLFCCQSLPALLLCHPLSSPAFHTSFLSLQHLITERFHSAAEVSGCTGLIVALRTGVLHCAGVGDSRAVVVRRSNRKWVGVALSTDHKPSTLEEAERVLKKGGRIDSLRNSRKEPAGPLRVWVGSSHSPGLAMTRSLGDTFVHTVGVISEPDSSHTVLTEADRAVVLGSDGLWDVLTIEEVAEFVGGFEQTASECSKELSTWAQRCWLRTHGQADDITVVVVYFH